MNEEWKDICFIENGVEYDYSGKYQVSNLGNIRSLNYMGRKTIKVLKPFSTDGKYLQIHLCKDGKKKQFQVHRLVAYMFIENSNPTEKTQVNHKNEITNDNRSCNLEWMTPKENINYGTGHERCVAQQRRKVIGISVFDGKVIVLKSVNSGKKFGFTPSSISNCCNGKIKHYKGYVWKFL